jgi:hypothetical protein
VGALKTQIALIRPTKGSTSGNNPYRLECQSTQNRAERLSLCAHTCEAHLQPRQQEAFSSICLDDGRHSLSQCVCGADTESRTGDLSAEFDPNSTTRCLQSIIYVSHASTPLLLCRIAAICCRRSVWNSDWRSFTASGRDTHSRSRCCFSWRVAKVSTGRISAPQVASQGAKLDRGRLCPLLHAVAGL